MDDIPICPDCVQGKHNNCTGYSWNNTLDEETACPCKDESHKPTFSKHDWNLVSPENDKKHDEIVKTITSVMYQSVMTRDDLEDMLGQPIFDAQWERVQRFLHNKPCTVIDCPRLKKEVWWDNKS